MKKVLFQILIIFFLSCEKESKEKCWICTEIATGYQPSTKSWEVCDVLEASHQDGRRWVVTTVISPSPNYVAAMTVHTITCKQ